MKKIVMSIALLVASIIMAPVRLRAPMLPGALVPAAGVGTARAAVCHEPRPAFPAALPRFEAIHASAYAVPADHPRPPLGRFKLTAYSGPQQKGAIKAITASGTSARAGRTVAVDPRIIPLGSRVYIEGIGERIAEDVGGAVKGRHIDVYVPTVGHARKFGVQKGTVSVIALPERDS